MTIQEAAHELYLRYGPGQLSCVAAIVYSEPDGLIRFYLARKPVLPQIKDAFRKLRDEGFEGYQVTFRVTGPMRFCDANSLPR